MPSDTFDILVACTKNGGIGYQGKIPWYLQPDLKWFQTKTTETIHPHKRNAIIMGRNTWNSLPKKPLKNRRNIVLTTSKMVEDIIAEGGEVYRSLDDALEYLKKDPVVEQIFVIGGGKLYETAISHPVCKCVYLTRIEKEYECDTFFPIEFLKDDNKKIDDNNKFKCLDSITGLAYRDISYSCFTYRKNSY